MKTVSTLKRYTEVLLQHDWLVVLLAFSSTMVGLYAARVMSSLPLLIGLAGLLFCVALNTYGIVLAGLQTLMKGAFTGMLVMIAATVPYLTTLYFPAHNEVLLSTKTLWVWMGVGVAIASNLLTWVFAVMLKRRSGWSTMLQVAALMGALVISLLHLFYPAVIDWWGAQLMQLKPYYHQAAVAAGNTISMPDVSNEGQTEVSNALKQMMNGFVVVVVLLNAIVQLILARWWQSAAFSPGSLGYELRAIRLSRLAGLLYVMSIIFSYMGNGVVLDVMPIVYVLFTAAGLSLLHYVLKQIALQYTWFWLMVMYILIAILLPISLSLISILAFFDIYFNVRKQMRAN